jgi:hypothetical protein
MSFNQHKRLSIKMQELKGIHGNMIFDQTISELTECYNRGKTNEVNMIHVYKYWKCILYCIHV